MAEGFGNRMAIMELLLDYKSLRLILTQYRYTPIQVAI